MDSRSRTEYSILNIIAGVGGYIVNTILGFICRMVFVKCLAADYLGVNGLFTNAFFGRARNRRCNSLCTV